MDVIPFLVPGYRFIFARSVVYGKPPNLISNPSLTTSPAAERA